MKPEIVMDFVRLTAAHGTQHPSGEMLYSFYYEHLLHFAEMIEREVREEDDEAYKQAGHPLPEQEPVGYASEGAAERLTTVKQAHEQIRSFKLFTHDVPLYTTPPQRPWVNLTSEEIGEIYRVGWANNMELARAIEAKLKEKNE